MPWSITTDLCSGILPLASDSAAGSRSHLAATWLAAAENLTYAYLGEWITRQKDGVSAARAARTTA